MAPYVCRIHRLYFLTFFSPLIKSCLKKIIFRRRLRKPLLLCPRIKSINENESSERTRMVCNLLVPVTHVTHMTVPASLILLLSLSLAVR